MHRALRNSLPAVLVSALFAGCETDRATPLGAGTPDSPGSVALSTQGIPEFPSSPDEFVDGITNPYLAFQRGKVFRYEGQTEEGVETTVVEVLNKTKRILGVATTVVHDRVYLDGELIEDTFDWYAQDRSGNVWYFGEDSKTIEDGKVVSTEGSWQAGVNGARPGIVMLAQPNVGDQYQQEFASGVAEDRAKVMSLSEVVQVPYGTFTGCLQTQEWTPLAPGPRESKYYAPGVGLVLETAPGGERVELIAIEN
jgi:hypothetical protein